MQISGFTFMRNTSKLYYPFIESIKSILPLVDEFVIALGNNDSDDVTEMELKKIGSEKIKIIYTIWDTLQFQKGTVYAHQTDIAKSACKGNWLFYLQSDEVVHERYLDVIHENCKKYLDNKMVDGFLFSYKHFWGDYQHYVQSHAWYPYEIRIIRNDPEIHSYGDAQSFKRIKNFDGLNYRTKEGISKLNVRLIEACIYHYGWVRPPIMMQTKSREMAGYYHDKETVNAKYKPEDFYFDYGNMNDYMIFEGSHPEVMKNFISKFDWYEFLHYDKDYKPSRKLLKHERTKYKILSWLEQSLLEGRQIFGYRNWHILP